MLYIEMGVQAVRVYSVQKRARNEERGELAQSPPARVCVLCVARIRRGNILSVF